MTLFAAALCFLFGLIAGSFINVVAIRIPAGGSIVSPGSACAACGHPIRPRDNVPLVSWLLLRGRCRDCGARISARYPIVELSTAVLFSLTPIVIGVVWVLPAYLWFVGVTVTLTITDIDHKLIPNKILYPGTVVGAVLLGLGSLLDGTPRQFVRGLGGAGLYFTVLLVIALIAKGGFGFGDVKLAVLLGLFTAYHGWDILVVAFLLAFLLGGLISIFLLITRIRGRKDAIPFGPYLIAGAYLALALGDPIIAWYLP